MKPRTMSRLAWLLSVPLMVAGSLSAHAVAYRLAYSDPRSRASELAASGHRYLDHVPLLVGIVCALVLVGIALEANRAFRGAGALRASAWPFAILPPLGFALQEHLERLLHDGVFPFGAVLDPTFRTGLLLQLPFALAAYLVARLLLALARSAGRALRAAEHVRGPALALGSPLAFEVDAPRGPVAASGWTNRGPPSRR
jgi:hypothetical protein